MGDVSCKAVRVYLGEAERRGLDLSAYLRDFPHQLDFLRNGDNRITWFDFAELGHRLRTMCNLSDDDLVNLGKSALKTWPVRFMFVARLFAAPAKFYQRVGKAHETSFANVRSKVDIISNSRVDIDIRLRNDDEISMEYFLVAKGRIAGIPALLGYPEADVELQWTENGARFEVQLANKRPSFGRGLLGHLLGTKRAADGVVEADRRLELRFFELQSARTLLDHQARQLAVAHAIGQFVHVDLDLDRTVSAVADALVTVGEYLGAEVRLETSFQGKMSRVSARAGVASEGDPIASPLVSRGRSIGEVRTWPSASHDPRERSQLLEFVLPTLSMALANAISHHELARSIEEAQRIELRALSLRLHQSEKLATLGTLSAGLAHEMRNPANAIVNAIEPLTELLPPELRSEGHPVSQLVGVLRECSSHIAMLSRQLLGWKRPGELEYQASSVADVVSRAHALTSPLFRSVELREELAYTGPLDCAAPLLTQVLSNLLENGAHAAGSGGWVKLHSRLDGERAVLEVSDSGQGVPVELRERIFEPFFTTKPPGSGTGLGLTMARQIVERHCGTLDVREAPGGTLFHIDVPVRAEPGVSQRQRGGGR